MYTELDILAWFFEDPTKGFYIREIARLTHLSPMTVRAYISRFVKQGFLLSTDSGLYTTYLADVQSLAYRHLKLYYNLEKLRKAKLISDLEDFYEYPTIVLFGSYAKARDVSTSDIDIFVLSPVDKDFHVLAYEKVLRRKISIHRFTDKEFQRMKVKNFELVNNICNGIVISGRLELL